MAVIIFHYIKILTDQVLVRCLPTQITIVLINLICYVKCIRYVMFELRHVHGFSADSKLFI